MPPETRYTRSGNLNIAYQVVGEGPIDLVYVPGWVSHEETWEMPSLARFVGRLASFSRLILFDKRGTGMSIGWRWTAYPPLSSGWTNVRIRQTATG